MSEPTLAQITAVYKRLAERHAARRQALDSNRLWRRIQLRSRARTMGPPQRIWALIGATAVALTVGLAIAANRWSATLSYELDGVTLQKDMIRSGDMPGIVRFSDGSRVALSPSSALALSVVGNHGALARLTRGSLHVRVTHSRDTDWRFLAGPYEVRVIGTEFDLGWDASLSRMTLVMQEGRVQVVGPADTVRTLGAGESLVLGPPQVQAQVPELPAAPVVAELPAMKSSESRAAAVAGAAGPSWTKLVAKGRFDEVVQTADGQGIDRVLAQNGVADLKALAHAAHYTGRTALALRSWTTLQKRFGDTPAGHQAAFFMGRIHDQQGRPAEALRWFDRYLSNSPNDVYASEALGRKLTLVRRLSGITAAQKLAREYVTRFPKGSYVQTARDMLAQQ
jgi:hypothetical protein